MSIAARTSHPRGRGRPRRGVPGDGEPGAAGVHQRQRRRPRVGAAGRRRGLLHRQPRRPGAGDPAHRHDRLPRRRERGADVPRPVLPRRPARRPGRGRAGPGNSSSSSIASTDAETAAVHPLRRRRPRRRRAPGVPARRRRLADDLERLGVPTVLNGRPFEPDSGAVQRRLRQRRAGPARPPSCCCRAARARIATITGPLDMSAGQDRLAGYRRPSPRPGDRTPEAAVAEGDFTVRRRRRGDGAGCSTPKPGIDAVFAASDLMALGALRTLADRGRQVPARRRGGRLRRRPARPNSPPRPSRPSGSPSRTSAGR